MCHNKTGHGKNMRLIEYIKYYRDLYVTALRFDCVEAHEGLSRKLFMLADGSDRIMAVNHAMAAVSIRAEVTA